MPPDRPLASKKNHLKSGPYARDNRTSVASMSIRDGAKSVLSQILSKLGHLKFTSDCVISKDPVKDTHGGYCDKEDRSRSQLRRYVFTWTKEKRVAKTLAREMDVWSKLKHPNILPFLSFIIEKDYPSLISEWIEHGTLTKFLKKCPNPDIVRLSLGLAEGLKYMHDRDFVHSDLKADNVLISPSGDPLICDFGISRVLTSSENDFVSTTHDGRPRGPARWMAIELHVPENGVEPRHSKESDVWAFGMTLYEMLAKEVPYAHLKYELHVLFVIMKGEIPTLPGFRTDMNLSPFLYSMICAFCKGCWALNPADRPRMAQITLTLSLHLNDMGRQQHQTGLTGFNRLGVPFSQLQCSISSGPPNGLDQGHDSRNESSTQTAAPGADSSLKVDDDESESMQTLRGNIVDTNMKNFIAGARSVDHRDNHASLESLAGTLIERFEHGGDVGHLMEAIELRRSALALCVEGHPAHSKALNNLGYSLRLRFEEGGAIEDIMESVECHRSALALLPEDHPDRSLSLNNLGCSLSLRFEEDGTIKDIRESIECYRSALVLLPEGHPDRSKALNNLGYSLRLRFEEGGTIEDIRESIECHRSALVLLPEGHPDRSKALNNLGCSLSLRFQRGDAIEDITESIECHRSALALRPGGHPDRSKALNNLGYSLRLRFEEGGTIEDIRESIECYRSALALCPEGHPDRSLALNNLENVLNSRSRHSGSVKDLEGSIEHHREPLALCQAQQSNSSS
ncbi:hypothetical protein ACEPAG_7227 [Sanghuangporus baumii]